MIHRYFSGKQNTLRKEPDKNTTPSDEDTPEEEDEVQTKLMEVTKTLQSLQKAVHQFRRKTPAVRIREDEPFFLKLRFNLFYEDEREYESHGSEDNNNYRLLWSKLAWTPEGAIGYSHVFSIIICEVTNAMSNNDVVNGSRFPNNM